MEPVIETLLNHRSIRKYQDKEVSEDVLNLIISSGQMSSTSNNFQAYSIIKVDSEEARRGLYEISGDQEWLLQAPAVLLFCGDLHRGKTYFTDVENRDVFSNTESFIVATIDAALAAQKAFITAELLGLGGVFVGGIRNDMDKVAEIFQLPDFVFPLFAICLGYPDDNPGLKPRLPRDLICKVDSYPSKGEEKLIKEYDQTNYAYYFERSGGKNPEYWTERSSRMLEEKPRYNVGEYLRRRGLLKK